MAERRPTRFMGVSQPKPAPVEAPVKARSKLLREATSEEEDESYREPYCSRRAAHRTAGGAAREPPVKARSKPQRRRTSRVESSRAAAAATRTWRLGARRTSQRCHAGWRRVGWAARAGAAWIAVAPRLRFGAEALLAPRRSATPAACGPATCSPVSPTRAQSLLHPRRTLPMSLQGLLMRCRRSRIYPGWRN